ncbi:uncharacterized protein [Spinacia oleracea]|uniref:Aspartic peptidase DDI1-type domain-containing protein n=1 Tax=Spinacia oleracea TaxID=3562 RepID=A0ABM3RRN0_SPIOL|nr:uncharacterized protein LOC130471946 [Spinacia oleracea]
MHVDDSEVSISGPLDKVNEKVVTGKIIDEKVAHEKEVAPEVKKGTKIQVPPIVLSFPNRQLKNKLGKKRAYCEVETMAFTKECSALLQNKSPPKLKDPEGFSIPCNIGTVFIKALCDLGVSLSVMPLSVCTKLKINEFKVTNITLQMDDRSVKYPLGVLEDVPVRVVTFYIFMDFVVLDMQ